MVVVSRTVGSVASLLGGLLLLLLFFLNLLLFVQRLLATLRLGLITRTIDNNMLACVCVCVCGGVWV